MTISTTTNGQALKVSAELLDCWAESASDAVALCLRQKLIPIEGEQGIVFPPTYADIGYNIDLLSDGSRLATIDSVASQANRMEPIFMSGDPARLVPQISIRLDEGRAVSMFEAGHRLGDAIVRCSQLKDDARQAFLTYMKSGDATPLARLAPTSLVFGVWDSRDTSVKLPRIVQSVVRAWNVDPLTRSAQYSPPVDYATLDVFTEEDGKKQENDPKSPLAKRGFVHVPASRAPGGVVVHGEIIREVTVNLIALRRLSGGSDGGERLRRYILGLALVAVTEPMDGFLRQGCFLTPDPKVPARWECVERDGERQPVDFGGFSILGYARAAVEAFGKGPDREVDFDRAAAKADVTDSAKKKSAKK